MLQPDRYLPDEEYDALIEALIAAGQGDDPHLPDDPQSAIRTILGEHLSIWPASIVEGATQVA